IDHVISKAVQLYDKVSRKTLQMMVLQPGSNMKARSIFTKKPSILMLTTCYRIKVFKKIFYFSVTKPARAGHL
ncbi:hypothetical protein ACDT20_13875, partial [Staphylococcus aureus]